MQYSMVENVVRVLNRVGRWNNQTDVSLLENDIYSPRANTERPRHGSRHKSHLSKTTGEYDRWSKEKERERKDIKRVRPNAKLKFDGQKWKIRKQEKEEIENRLHQISEISFRTGAITIGIAKVKQYASRVDKGIQKMKSLGSTLQNTTDEKEKSKIQGEITKTDAEVLHGLRKMGMYSTLVSASGGLGADRTLKYLKKLQKQKR